MAEAAIDLDAYFARIGYAGSRAPTLETLRALHWAHIRTIPFENLDVLSRRPIRLDPSSLQQKLIAGHRGGYCFESNALLMYALRELGFQVTALAARVLWARADPAPPGRTHMLLRVDLPEGAHLVDVAFGGLTPTRPLKLAAGIEQETAHGPFRLREAADGDLDLEAYLQNEEGEIRWAALYRLSLRPQLPVDYEHANWYVSTHAESFFVHSLIAAIPLEECRYTVFDREFKTRFPDGTVETRVIADPAELLEILEGPLGLRLTQEDRDGMGDLFARLAPPETA